MEDFNKGFIHIPHSIYNSLPITDLTIRERRVIDLIIRLTYGCHVQSVKLKYADFSIVNIKPSHIKKVILSLLDRQIILRNEKTKEYRINNSYFTSKATDEMHNNLKKLRTLVGIQISIQKGKDKFTTEATEALPILEEPFSLVGNSTSFPEREELNYDSTDFSRPKDIIKIFKNSDKDIDIADINISSKKIDPDEFVPSDSGEYLAHETWKRLEPNNKKSFSTTYLHAYKRNLPEGLFGQFASEIEQDPSIKNKGAVFNRKVQEYFNKRK